MDRPRVIIHNLISLDGRLDGFPADAGLYYEMASRLPHQAVLTGSGTTLAAAAGQGIDPSEEDPEPLPGTAAAGPAATGDPRPLLVIVDGQGRVTRYAWLREQPFWRDVLVLCSAATPAGQLDRLRRHRVGHVVLGEGRVDLGGALGLLAQRHQVGAVRVDAGGGLNGALLQAGLADQVSIVIAPHLAATATAGPVPLIADPGCPDAVALELAAVERLRQGTCGCGTTCEINLTVTAEVVTGRHHERAKAGSVLAALGARGRRRPGSTLTQGTLGAAPSTAPGS